MTQAERDAVLAEAMAAIEAKHLVKAYDAEDRAYDLGLTDAYCAVKQMLSQYRETK
jgi:UTP-glucose-1-phosphate uridylyltransferase